jgi:hypothetical protein
VAPASAIPRAQSIEDRRSWDRAADATYNIIVQYNIIVIRLSASHTWRWGSNEAPKEELGSRLQRLLGHRNTATERWRPGSTVPITKRSDVRRGLTRSPTNPPGDWSERQIVRDTLLYYMVPALYYMVPAAPFWSPDLPTPNPTHSGEARAWNPVLPGPVTPVYERELTHRSEGFASRR